MRGGQPQAIGPKLKGVLVLVNGTVSSNWAKLKGVFVLVNGPVSSNWAKSKGSVCVS